MIAVKIWRRFNVAGKPITIHEPPNFRSAARLRGSSRAVARQRHSRSPARFGCKPWPFPLSCNQHSESARCDIHELHNRVWTRPRMGRELTWELIRRQFRLGTARKPQARQAHEASKLSLRHGSTLGCPVGLHLEAGRMAFAGDPDACARLPALRPRPETRPRRQAPLRRGPGTPQSPPGQHRGPAPAIRGAARSRPQSRRHGACARS